MNNNRPVNLDLGTMKFPVMAIASILHRMSGILLFLLLPLMMWFLQQSLESSDAFMNVQLVMAHPFHKVLLWAFSSALSYHLLAGIRHMVMDLGVGESLCAGRAGAILVIGVAIVLTILLGIWIW